MSDAEIQNDESKNILIKIVRDILEENRKEHLFDLVMQVIGVCEDSIEARRQTHDVGEVVQAKKSLRMKIQSMIERHDGENN